MDMMSTLNILNSRQIFKEFLKPVSCFRVPFFEIPKFGTVWIWQQKVPQSMKKALIYIFPITWPKKTKSKMFVYIICLVRAQFWKCVRFSDFLVTLGLRSQISDDSNGEISLDDKRFRFESKSLEQGQTFCRRKNNEMYFYFLRNYSINYFRCFLWCGPKADL